MLSPQLRGKVHGLWTMFWSAGMTNPLVAIEQITYLLFLRQLEHFDRVRVQSGKPTIYYKRKAEKAVGGTPVDYDVCRWENIRQNPSFKLFNDTVFPWLRGLEKWLKDNNPSNHDPLGQITGRLDDAYFVLDPNKSETLNRAVQAIHELFDTVGGANADIMGDIFEYLLGEIQSAGKNGQFRTPRHVIRFMVELVDPPPTTNGRPTKILDPACGTGGFLVNTLIHWRKRATDPEQLRLEWDGTPHRTYGSLPEGLDPNDCFFGYDNDRTMVRIAWMNLILHDLDFPKIEQLDSLSKQLENEKSGSFDYILANPPFTGTVDESDLSRNRDRVEWRGKNPLTTKSELLFVWMMLDLLRTGGRCAVVVPDGVLFGSTNAHRELRRKLLFENTLEGVVSLPGGVFNPYSGVKTSILVFQKVGDEPRAGQEPRTREVWFYEVAEEAKTLDQKRKDREGRNNDLYDASEKFHGWYEVAQGSDLPKLRETATSTAYFQPKYWKERWRVVDDGFLRIFPEEESQKGHALGLHEIFPGLPADPAEMTKTVSIEGRQLLGNLTLPLVKTAWESASKEKGKVKRLPKAMEELGKSLGKINSDLNKAIREMGFLDREFDEFGYKALRADLKNEESHRVAMLEAAARGGWNPDKATYEAIPANALEAVLKCYARLDGYDIWLRSPKSEELPEKPRNKDDEQPSSDVLAWVTPVRTWARFEAWKDPKSDKVVEKPTHDAEGFVVAAYVKWLAEQCNAFDDDGTVKPNYLELLDADCIEASDLNLSAGRYKPFVISASQHQRPEDLIRKLDKVHGDIRTKLAQLLSMVEGRA